MGSKQGKCQEEHCIESSEALECQNEHKGSINCMVMSEDGSLIVTGSDDCTARMWSAQTSPTECLGVLKGHEKRITCAAVSQAFVFTGSEDATIRKWDMCSSECLYVYKGHTLQVQRIICCVDFLISTSYDKTVKVWHMEADDVMDEDEACLRTLQGHHRPVYSVIFIAGEDMGGLNEEGFKINPGDLIITGSIDHTARSWSLDLGVSLKTFTKHSAPITCMDSDQSGRILYTGSHDCTVNVWSISSGRCLRTLEGHKSAITCLKVVNRLLYTGSADSKIKCWVREFGDCTRTYKIANKEVSVVCLKFHGGLLFAGYTDHSLRAFDAKSGTLKRDFKGHTDAVNYVTVCGKRAYSASSDGTLRVWDVSKIRTDEELFEMSAATRASRKRTAVSPMVGHLPITQSFSESDDESSTTESEDEPGNQVNIDDYIERYLGDDDVDAASTPAQ